MTHRKSWVTLEHITKLGTQGSQNTLKEEGLKPAENPGRRTGKTTRERSSNGELAAETGYCSNNSQAYHTGGKPQHRKKKMNTRCPRHRGNTPATHTETLQQRQLKLRTRKEATAGGRTRQKETHFESKNHLLKL